MRHLSVGKSTNLAKTLPTKTFQTYKSADVAKSLILVKLSELISYITQIHMKKVMNNVLTLDLFLNMEE